MRRLRYALAALALLVVVVLVFKRQPEMAAAVALSGAILL